MSKASPTVIALALLGLGIAAPVAEAAAPTPLAPADGTVIRNDTSVVFEMQSDPRKGPSVGIDITASPDISNPGYHSYYAGQTITDERPQDSGHYVKLVSFREAAPGTLYWRTWRLTECNYQGNDCAREYGPARTLTVVDADYTPRLIAPAPGGTAPFGKRTLLSWDTQFNTGPAFAGDEVYVFDAEPAGQRPLFRIIAEDGDERTPRVLELGTYWWLVVRSARGRDWPSEVRTFKVVPAPLDTLRVQTWGSYGFTARYPGETTFVMRTTPYSSLRLSVRRQGRTVLRTRKDPGKRGRASTLFPWNCHRSGRHHWTVEARDRYGRARQRTGVFRVPTCAEVVARARAIREEEARERAYARRCRESGGQVRRRNGVLRCVRRGIIIIIVIP